MLLFYHSFCLVIDEIRIFVMILIDKNRIIANFALL